MRRVNTRHILKAKNNLPVRMYSFISRVCARTLVQVHKRESTINKCLIKKLKNYGRTAKNEAGRLHTTD